MVTVSATVDGAAARALETVLGKIKSAYGEYADKAPKIVALGVCDSLRARTMKAPKKSPPKEYSADYSQNPPKYITYRRGVKLARPLHRWTLTRKLGTPAQYTKDHFVYVHTKETKRGKIVKDRAAELRELKQYHLGIAHAGLAKVSWNKAKQEIKTGHSDVVWKRRKHDRREPLKDVSGSYAKKNSATVASGVVEIHNHLDYIAAALQPGALSEAMAAQVKKLAYNHAKAFNLTPQQAADYAMELVRSLGS